MPVEDQRETRGYRVTGRVQGVGFRWWTVGVAENLQLGGSVRNLPDGSVEVRAVGRVADLDRLEVELRAGPRFSVVEGLERFHVEVGLRADVFRIER